jgi:thiol-disulfide isomerase/thioredoxin
LPAVDGKTYARDDFGDKRALVVMFICNHCPYVKAIRERIVRDAKELRTHGIGSIAIMSNDPSEYPEDSFPSMKRVALEFGFPFPYVLDETQSVAQAYGAVCTPEFFGFNADLELQYHGRLDASRTAPIQDARRELFEAMVQIAATGRGPAEQTTAIGCSIKWKRS